MGREIDFIRAELRRLGLMGSAHDRRDGADHDSRKRQERYDDEHGAPEDRELLRGGDGFSWTLIDLYREELEKRANALRVQRMAELQRRAATYPLDNDTWWDDMQRASRRPDLRSVAQKSVDFTDDERKKVRQVIGFTRADWDAVAGRKSRAPRTAAEAERYAELGRRVDTAIAAWEPGGVKLVCEAYSTNRVTVSKLRSFTR